MLFSNCPLLLTVLGRPAPESMQIHSYYNMKRQEMIPSIPLFQHMCREKELSLSAPFPRAH